LTFADPEMVKMLKSDFIPVAIDQWYHRRQKDSEGEFYRKIASQGPRNDFNATTQGRYICSPDGTLLGYNNNRGPERISKLMKVALAKFEPESLNSVKRIDSETSDPKYSVKPPKDGLILRVHSKVLDGYEPTENWTVVFQRAIGRDNAWLTADEKAELMYCIGQGGEIPKKIAQRIARFHLIDNTRGEPPRWQPSEIKSLSLRIDKDGGIRGAVHLETKDGKRGYKANLLGVAKVAEGEIVQFDLVSKGEFWGTGPYTGFAPDGQFPFAVAFRIADGTDPADAIAPHGTKGWVEGYFGTRQE
jgi:hypothetical protein